MQTDNQRDFAFGSNVSHPAVAYGLRVSAVPRKRQAAGENAAFREEPNPEVQLAQIIASKPKRERLNFLEGRPTSQPRPIIECRQKPNDPVPLRAWHGGAPEILAAVMEKAIRTGEPLTPNELLKVQGLVEPPPGDAVT